MADSSPEVKKYFFKKTNLAKQGEFSMNADMFRLLMAVDEKKEIFQIAKELNMNNTALKDSLSKLLKLNLVERINKTEEVKEEPKIEPKTYIDAKFFDILRKTLIENIGPMGDFLIEDVQNEMKLNLAEVSIEQAAEFVSNLAREVPDKDARLKFQKSMINEINKQTK
ncbi:MAG: hypothetical protein HQK76_09020 [Desulfobacterales bacterium]|nr:hypothetical protein [Desulfobacterales bacterium]